MTGVDQLPTTKVAGIPPRPLEKLESQAEVLSVLLMRQELSQSELARRLDVSPQRVSAVLKGQALQDSTYREWLAALGYMPTYGAVAAQEAP